MLSYRKRSMIIEEKWLRFEPPFGGLGAMYDDHLRLIGKRVVDFLLVLIKLFFAMYYGTDVMSEYRL